MFRTCKIATLLCLIALPLAMLSAYADEHLSIQGPWARPAAMGGNTAIYFTVVNAGKAPNTLVKASSNVAKMVALHQTSMEGGVMRMTHVPHIKVPAEGRTELKPGGLHVMVMGLKRDLKPGDMVKVTLQFEHGGEMTVAATVRQP
jgi:copper(I)-binding protein